MSQSIKLYNSEITIADDQFHLLGSCTSEKPEYFLTSYDYSRYIFCCLVTTSHDNLTFYKIPQSLKVYHGESFYGSSPSIPHGNLIFNLNAEDASSSGFIHEFVFEKPCELISLDRVSNIQIIVATALVNKRYDVVDALNNNFHYKTSGDKTQIFRQQNGIIDEIILEFLCSLGFEGFACKPLNEIPGQIVLCTSEKFMSSGRLSPYNDQFLISTSKLKMEHFV